MTYQVSVETVLQMLRERAVSVTPRSTEVAAADFKAVAQFAVIGQRIGEARGELDQ